jgi:hypothetical protein
MSHPILTQSFPNSITNFSNTLQFFDNKPQHSFAPMNFNQPSSNHYNMENIHSKYEHDSYISTSPSMFKYNNFQPLSIHTFDTQANSADMHSPSTSAFSRSDSKDEEQEDLLQKMKSPLYQEINTKVLLRGSPSQDTESEHGLIMLNERSKKILKRRSYKDQDDDQSESSKKNSKKGKRSSWSSAEDNKLLELMNTYGKKWSKIAAMMEGRTGKQVRDRYVNVLMPDINRTGWDESEDQLILSTYQQIGPKWSKIAENLQGRTEGQVKNRFYSFLKKKFGKEEETNKSSEESFFSAQQTIEKPVKMDNQEYNPLQQCLQRVEEISQTNFFEQKYSTQIKEINQYNNQSHYYPYTYGQNDYYTGSYSSPQSSVKIADPTDVISFDELNNNEAPSHLKYYLTEFENKMFME